MRGECRGGSMGDYQPCYKCVVTYPPLHPMDQMQEDQFMCCGVGVCNYHNMWYHDYCHLLLRKYHN